MTSSGIGQPHLFEPPPAITLTLEDRFLVPPFSVLECRAGYWRKRKQDWVNLGIRGELSREEALWRASEQAQPTPEQLGTAQELADLLGITLEAALAGQAQHPGLRSGEGRAENLIGHSAASQRQVEQGSAYPRGKGAAQAAEYEAGGLRSGEGRAEGLLGGLPGTGKGSGLSNAIGGGPRTKGAKQAALLQSGEGRADNLISQATVREGYGGDYDLTKGENAWGGSGTSVFDPVLCELVYRWFCPAGGHVLDPFAGGSVRGIVAAHLGLQYTGIDLSAQQVAANEQQREQIGKAYTWPHQPQWVVGDSAQPDTYRDHVKGTADFLFTCPPYYDLEVYSATPGDLSAAPTYAEFLTAYRVALAGACSRLAADRFAVLVVGEVRNKRTGAYIGLVPDTIKAMQDAGLSYYNEGILVTAVGSLPIRTSALFGPGRKLGKTHQNVLGFVKGDWRKAAAACPMPAEIAVEYGGATWRADGTVEVAEVDE